MCELTACLAGNAVVSRNLWNLLPRLWLMNPPQANAAEEIPAGAEGRALRDDPETKDGRPGRSNFMLEPLMERKSVAKGLAVVTGASSGIGLELAKIAASEGYDLIIAADEPEILDAARKLRASGVVVDAIEADLSTEEGVDSFVERVTAAGKPIDLLMANAGRGLGHGFLDQSFAEARRVVDTNITGTIYLVHCLGNLMRSQGNGRILFTGSIAGFMPGTFQAVYNATKSFINSFSFALREELQGSGISVTCLMPGATDTRFFERAHLLDTAVGQADKDDPAAVARVGFDAMMHGEGDTVSGWKNRLEAAIASITPASILARQHRKMAEPGSAEE